MSAVIPVAAELDPNQVSVEARSTLTARRTQVRVGGRWQALDVV